MVKVTHQNRYIQTYRGELASSKKCSGCDGNGWIYEFYNDPVSWRVCPHCCKEK